jgi:hypothetical protein
VDGVAVEVRVFEDLVVIICGMTCGKRDAYEGERK